MKTARINYVGTHDVSIYPPFFCISCAFQNCSPWCRWSTPRSDQSVPTSRLSWQDLGFRARAWEDVGRTGANIIFASNMSQMFLAPRFSFDSQILFGAKIIIIIVIIVITKGKHSCQGLPKHPRRWLQRWLGDTHQSANHNAGELWSQRWQKMKENQQCFGPKKVAVACTALLVFYVWSEAKNLQKKQETDKKALESPIFYVSKLAFPDLKGVA